MTENMELDNVQLTQQNKKQKVTRFNVPIRNTYECLNNDDDGQTIETILTKGNKQNNQISQKPPPINLFGITLQQLDNILKQLDKINYELKLTTEGIKLFAKTISVYKNIRELLKKANVQYYTHQLREEQMTKMVLHGLPDSYVITIVQALNEVNLYPVMVKNMQIKNSRYDGHAVFLVYFMKKDNVRLSDLIENHRVVHCIRVKWEHYKNPSKGPTQCRNCHRYGHGSNHCAIAPRCVRCAKNHKSEDCPLLKNEFGEIVRKRIDESELRCALCGLNHAASFKNC
ncbi:hypothetical protein PVAND_017808 [Polypedilum vanderplanki]|uniref:Gag-like protein n=1 Tax=Polypedilum vanderplanki TaxID=319348 RepID=A0A9J6B9F9_POLVA|nr:hypothetical protein PVAND_017808 [Polypedilum vanderplanki]